MVNYIGDYENHNKKIKFWTQNPLFSIFIKSKVNVGIVIKQQSFNTQILKEMRTKSVYL